MDLITQTVLGAAVGEVVLGKKAGNKAIMWGAVGGLFPDLDVLITPFFSDVNGLFVHRGFSHSLVFAFLLAPLLGWLIYRIHRKKMPITHFDWTKLIFWAAFTHPFLDYLTTYGTGAFLPFSGYRVEFSTVGIVDIFYTIPLLLVLVVIMFFNRASLVRRRLILGIVSLTSFYLAATVGNKIYMNSVFKDAFTEQNIEYKRFKTTPLPLTNFLWMGLAETESGYYMGLYSNFDNQKPQDFFFIPRNDHMLNDISENKELIKLIRFTKGFYHVNEDNNGLYLADLRFGRMGIDNDAEYIFKFYINRSEENITIEQAEQSGGVKEGEFAAFINRIKGI
jgi:inner membrane protein